MRRAAPIRDEDIFHVAMECFWAAPGGNDAGVKAVVEFCRNIFLDQADDTHQAILTAVDARLAMLARKHGGDVRDAAVTLRGLIAKTIPSVETHDKYGGTTGAQLPGYAR